MKHFRLNNPNVKIQTLSIDSILTLSSLPKTKMVCQNIIPVAQSTNTVTQWAFTCSESTMEA